MTVEQRGSLRKIAEAAVACERATGLPAELSAAQAALESGWLRAAPGNNCFGIKDTDRFPGCQYCLTKEYIDGSWQRCSAAFEVYPSLTACFTDHARLITEKPAYARPWAEYRKTGDLERLVRGIAPTYATDPAYANQIMRIIRMPEVRAAVAEARA